MLEEHPSTPEFITVALERSCKEWNDVYPAVLVVLIQSLLGVALADFSTMIEPTSVVFDQWSHQIIVPAPYLHVKGARITLGSLNAAMTDSSGCAHQSSHAHHAEGSVSTIPGPTCVVPAEW